MTKCADKKFKLSADEIKILLPHNAGCIATDYITVHGMKVDYMYREEPNNELDTGWRFFSGAETQKYIDDAENSCVFSLNTIANYDKDILPFLDLPVGTEIERNADGKLEIIHS